VKLIAISWDEKFNYSSFTKVDPSKLTCFVVIRVLFNDAMSTVAQDEITETIIQGQVLHFLRYVYKETEMTSGQSGSVNIRLLENCHTSYCFTRLSIFPQSRFSKFPSFIK
jgi:hypothetical protein